MAKVDQNKNLVNQDLAAFFDFSDEQMKAGHKLAVARVTTNGSYDDDMSIVERKIVFAAHGFGCEFVGNIFRSLDTESVNNDVRRQFLQAIMKEFGLACTKEGVEKLPRSVKAALRLDDFGKGLPLTARRIAAVKTAVLDVLPGCKLCEPDQAEQDAPLVKSVAKNKNLAKFSEILNLPLDTDCHDLGKRLFSVWGWKRVMLWLGSNGEAFKKTKGLAVATVRSCVLKAVKAAIAARRKHAPDAGKTDEDIIQTLTDDDLFDHINEKILDSCWKEMVQRMNAPVLPRGSKKKIGE